MQERKLLNLLIDLKENNNACGIKVEFETEYTSFEELQKLRQFVFNANLSFTVKIGGSGSIRDIIEAKKLNANTILTPMIESRYALKKFVESVKSVYKEEELKKLQLLINIETITGLKNIENIINSEEFEFIDGIVFGRNDMVSSIELEKDYVNSEEILSVANTIAELMEVRDKIIIIGGCVNENSINFFNKITSKAFTNFETRKVIFEKTENINEKSIQKAIEFEKFWLENKNEISEIDMERIKYLEKVSSKK